MDSLGYDDGITAMKRGGQMRFNKKFGWGGPNGTTWIPEIDQTPVDESYVYDDNGQIAGLGSDYYIRQYWNQHPDEYLKLHGSDEVAASKSGTNWGGIASGALGGITDIIGGFNELSEKRSAINRGINTYGQGVFDNVYDNASLLNAYGNMYAPSVVTSKDLRNKSIGQDALSAVKTGVDMFTSSGGNWYAAAAGVIGSALGSIGQRFLAKRDAEELEMERRAQVKKVDKQGVAAAQNVDAHNDFLRMARSMNSPFNYSAYGGELRTHGLDFNNGFTFINEGSTHEQNPFEGVPSGVDENGVPNLVEEGEVIWNNEYVFSNRIKIPKHLADKYRLDTSMTFADAIKEVTKESLTRPNDPISNETNKALVNEFMDEQEAIRGKEQAKAKAELQKAYDEDFANQLEMAQAMPQAMQGPVAPVQLQGTPQGTMEGVPMMGAFGGHKFDGGGWKDYYTIETDEYGNTYYLAPDGVKQYSEAGAKKHYELNGGSWVAPSVKTERVSKVEKAEPKDNVESVYSRDGRQFRGYRVRGTRGPIYGSYDIAKSVADGKGVPVAQPQQKKQAQAPQSAQQPAQTGQPASATVQQPQRARIEVVGNHIPDYRTQMLADLQTVLEGPVTFSDQLAEPLSEAIDRAVEENPDVAKQLAETVNKPVTQKPVVKTSPTGRTSGGTGSALRGKKDTRGADSEGNPLYKTLVETLDKASDEDKKAFVDEINKSLPEGKKVKDYDTWKKKATDGVWGSVHEATVNFVNARAEEAKTRAATTAVDPNPSKPLSTTVITPEEGLAGGISYRPSKSVPSTPESKTSSYGATDWARLAPIIGTGAMAFNDIIQGPKYGNADAIIAAARQAGVPVNIPVNTIGDYMTYKPFDERYLVNMANQNRAAAARGIINTANGNRAMDILGNMALAHSSQQELGEIMRQAYLANQTERARVAEFNRGTNIQNMSALNQRNLTQAQLNSQRQATALSGLARGYGMREEVWRDWRNDRDENLTAFLDNLGTWGREKETDSMAASLARELGYNWEYDPKTMQYVFKQTSAAKGGYKRKKRRF